ncbi:MAG: hypothetical protein IJ111_01405 [Eggerthellaceae bacterium]|nr:hypothetical protein [Eggerthellaceae bacterium]
MAIRKGTSFTDVPQREKTPSARIFELELDLELASNEMAELASIARDLFRFVHYGPCRAACDHYSEERCGCSLDDADCWYEERLKSLGIEVGR